jgi:arsenite transporter
VATTTTSTAPETTITAPATTTTTEPETASLVVYFLLDELDDDDSTPGPFLVPVHRTTSASEGDAALVVELLLAGPSQAETAGIPMISTAIPDGTTLLGIHVEAGTATVDLSDEYDGGGGSFGMFARLAQVVFTLTRLPDIDQVVFNVAGEQVTIFSAEGIVLDGPQQREGYYDLLLPPVFVDAPAWGEPVTVLERLSNLDRFLPLWIGAAMVAGLGLGRMIPDLNDWLDAIKIGNVSLPIAVGLLVMMYPVLAKVRYSKINEVATDRKLMATSLVLNWLVGPALMFALAWLLLPDLPEYRTGLIIIGLARCIAMVLIWNDLACGDREAAAVLVAINSVFQIVAYAVLGYFYLELLPGWLGLDTSSLDVSMWEIAKIVLVFLGIPLVAGYLTRRWGEQTRRGVEWYENASSPRSLRGLSTDCCSRSSSCSPCRARPSRPTLDVARIASPTVPLFRADVGRVSFALGLRLRMGTPRTRRELHRRQQQLRAGHRRCHRCVRGDLRRGPRRRGWAVDRSACAGRSRLRRPLGTPPLLPGRLTGTAMTAPDGHPH